MPLLRQKSARWWLVMTVVVLSVIGLGAHVFGYPVHYYEGRALPAGEFLSLIEAGHELHCNQLPRTTLWDHLRLAGSYECFDAAPEQPQLPS